MVINEKPLLALMKQAYKKDGYHVLQADDTITIMASTWVVCCAVEMLPKKVLATIVEHMGRLPDSNAYKLSKAATQKVMEAEILATLEQLRDDDDPDTIIRQTQIVWQGVNIWQRIRDLRILLVPPDLSNLGSAKHDPICSKSGNRISIYGSASEVHIVGVTDFGNNYEQFRYLSNMQWV